MLAAVVAVPVVAAVVDDNETTLLEKALLGRDIKRTAASTETVKACAWTSAEWTAVEEQRDNQEDTLDSYSVAGDSLDRDTHGVDKHRHRRNTQTVDGILGLVVCCSHSWTAHSPWGSVEGNGRQRADTRW